MNIENNYGSYPENLVAAVRGELLDVAKSESITLDQRKGLSYALCMLHPFEEDMVILRYRFHKNFTELAVYFEMPEDEVKDTLREAIDKLRYYQYAIEQGVDALVERMVESRNSKLMFEEFMRGYRLGAHGIDEEEKAIRMEVLLEDTPFTIRTWNCLRRAGVKTVGDLLKYEDPESIKAIRNMSKKCFQEVAKYLFTEGIGNDAWETFLE